LDTVATAFSLALYFVSLALIFERFGTMGGWRLAEIAFLYGMVEASFGWMDMIFSGFDPQMFGQHIRRGTFDQLLLLTTAAVCRSASMSAGRASSAC
jgi:ABC-2 type transport system permease protein